MPKEPPILASTDLVHVTALPDGRVTAQLDRTGRLRVTLGKSAYTLEIALPKKGGEFHAEIAVEIKGQRTVYGIGRTKKSKRPALLELPAKKQAEAGSQEARKEAVAVAAAEVPKAGTCRICGCTEGNACKIGEDQHPCGWADETQTLCNNPDCLAKAQPETVGNPS